MTDPDSRLLGNRRGYDVLRNPLLNKGSAFTPAERVALGLEGILPPQHNDMAQQAQRSYAGIDPAADARRSTSTWRSQRCRTATNTCSIGVVRDHIEEFMPIIYTPTVGPGHARFQPRVPAVARRLDHAVDARPHSDGAAQCRGRAAYPADGGDRQRIDSRHRRPGRWRHRHLDRQAVVVHRGGGYSSGRDAADQPRRRHRQPGAARRSAVSRRAPAAAARARSTTRSSTSSCRR